MEDRYAGCMPAIVGSRLAGSPVCTTRSMCCDHPWHDAHVYWYLLPDSHVLAAFRCMSICFMQVIKPAFREEVLIKRQHVDRAYTLLGLFDDIRTPL